MKNRNGFTLVELLAVIAILAILVIIALPNVINMYNKAQKQTFLTEARNVYREAEKKFLANSISGKNTKVFNSEDSTKLDMNGKKLQYCVILNNGGKVSDMKVSNGKWVASLNGKAIDELTIDDLEDGNLDDYECEGATDESCFTYETLDEGEAYGTLMVTIEDANKCKNYLVSNIDDMTEENATTLCNGDIYYENNNTMSIHSLMWNNLITSGDYSAAGISTKYMMVEKVEVVDVEKCKNFYNLINYTEEESTKMCTTNERVNFNTLQDDVSYSNIPNYYYEKAGLKVTTRNSDTVISITRYNVDCGTDVVIPSKINGYNVVEIYIDAFKVCETQVNSNLNDEYKVNLLNYKFNEKYGINKLGTICNSKALTSVVLPNTLKYIGNYAFSYNVLTEVIIPSSVEYIGAYAFSNNKLKTVIYDGNESNIRFGYCPFGGNSDYSKASDYCQERPTRPDK